MKTSEMIAMLEKNPKLKFKTQDVIGVKAVEYNVVGIINNRLCWLKEDGTRGNDYLINILFFDTDWQLVREPVPVWEAIKALKEGKRIKGVFKDEGEVVFEPNPPGYMYIKDILSGTWYILDEQEGER